MPVHCKVLFWLRNTKIGYAAVQYYGNSPCIRNGHPFLIGGITVKFKFGKLAYIMSDNECECWSKKYLEHPKQVRFVFLLDPKPKWLYVLKVMLAVWF